MFEKLAEIAGRRGLDSIIYGVNADDTGDFRPGHRAADQHGVRSPLLEAGLTKAEIRELARQAGLPVWDRPASACLSSRIPYGTPVTIQNIKMVENGEDEIRALGFRQFRVRHHGGAGANRDRPGGAVQGLLIRRWRRGSGRFSSGWAIST